MSSTEEFQKNHRGQTIILARLLSSSSTFTLSSPKNLAPSPNSPPGSTCRVMHLPPCWLAGWCGGWGDLHCTSSYSTTPHLLYWCRSTLTPPISVLLFMRTGPLKLLMFTPSLTWQSKLSMCTPLTHMTYSTCRRGGALCGTRAPTCSGPSWPGCPGARAPW